MKHAGDLQEYFVAHGQRDVNLECAAGSHDLISINRRAKEWEFSEQQGSDNLSVPSETPKPFQEFEPHTTLLGLPNTCGYGPSRSHVALQLSDFRSPSRVQGQEDDEMGQRLRGGQSSPDQQMSLQDQEDDEMIELLRGGQASRDQRIPLLQDQEDDEMSQRLRGGQPFRDQQMSLQDQEDDEMSQQLRDGNMLVQQNQEERLLVSNNAREYHHEEANLFPFSSSLGF